MPHLNNKQNKNTNPIISRQDYHLTQPCPSEEKQRNKNSAQISPYRKLTQTTGPILGGQKPKRKKEFNLKAWEKETSNTISFKKIMKRQRNTTQMKEKTRNTEVQIIEEEIGKLPEKEFRIMIVKVIKNLENRMEKMQEN